MLNPVRELEQRHGTATRHPRRQVVRHKVTLISGDGIGPEISAAAIQVLAAVGAPLVWEVADAGASAVAKHGTPLPESTLASIRKNGLCLKGPLSPPMGGGAQSVNVMLRRELDLFANVRPAKSFAGVRSRYENVNLVLIRENTQGNCSGIEHYIDADHSAAEAIAVVTRDASERLIRFAFQHAQPAPRKTVTLVHKANTLKVTSGLFLDVGREVARAYPAIAFNEIIVDRCAMQLVREPESFDVIVATNLFGDILSELTAGLVGGLGLVAGANVGMQAAIFEAMHGTAPDIAGKGVANPTALIMAGAMLLEHLGLKDSACRLESAVSAVIARGTTLTPDLGGGASTRAFADRVVSMLRPLPLPDTLNRRRKVGGDVS